MTSSLFSDVTQRTLVFADVSGQPVGPIFKDYLDHEDGIGRSFRNVGKYQYTLCNIREERRSCYTATEVSNNVC